MLYYIYTYLTAYYSPFNVLQYITLRSAAAMLTALIVSFLISPVIIRKLKKYKICQNIREDGPKTHYVKSGTPTMGGLIILISLLSAVLLWGNLGNRFIVILLISTIYLGLLGFVDDYLKLIKKHPKGVSARTKMIWQIIGACGLAFYLHFCPPNPEYGTLVNIPYFKNIFIGIGIFYFIFIVLIIVGASNAVNLTDGLDGLAVGSIIFASLTYMIFAYVAGHAKFSSYLRIVPVSGSGEIVVFLAALVGACLGFLWFNTYPAEIFMGDTGSLFLGGIIGVTAVIIKQEILLLVAGGIFVFEALSVILQVFSYKVKKKRIFKMAPLHHHFELSGWSEPKVVIRFWIIAIILSLLALSALKLR
ncbi:MAG: phospho-N-acetylmuramoyl-pentapeptide-transferase [Elusimicrobiota bacterium]